MGCSSAFFTITFLVKIHYSKDGEKCTLSSYLSFGNYLLLVLFHAVIHEIYAAHSYDGANQNGNSEFFIQHYRSGDDGNDRVNVGIQRRDSGWQFFERVDEGDKTDDRANDGEITNCHPAINWYFG